MSVYYAVQVSSIHVVKLSTKFTGDPIQIKAVRINSCGSVFY